jgi:peptidoglycan/xylan/chitin deacetylase (PgdA/CDA1 family)
MYHYVRRVAESRYPEIKGLERDLFIEQLKYIQRFYTPVSGQDVINALKGGGELPQNAILLTFDDGYLDHFVTVFPILLRERIPAVFFPPARCIVESSMLDVNKIHYILASVPDKSVIVSEIAKAIAEADTNNGLEPAANYYKKYAIANRFDSAEVIYIKRMLQFVLPLELRKPLTDGLFARHVSSDERAFAHELYMDHDQLRSLVQCGMMVGSHGYNHDWLNHLQPVDQARDIDRSLEFLRTIGVPAADWVMCYPYGGWCDSLLEILQSRTCAMGFTTETALAHIGNDNPLLLPRLDTNDLPKDGAAGAVPWTLAVQ